MIHNRSDVFIGATHSGTGDVWVTPSGLLPGVELLANTVRFLPLQSTTGRHAELAYRTATILSFLVMGLIGFLLVYVFYSTHRVRMAPLYVGMVCFGFAVTVGTLWEIFEFGMDWAFGFNMQKSGLVDTMTDLMVDTLGALLAACIAYRYARHGDAALAVPLVRRFVAENPELLRQADAAATIEEKSR